MSRDIPIKFHYYPSSLVESPKNLRGSQIPFYNSLKVFRTISLLLQQALLAVAMVYILRFAGLVRNFALI